jgi:transcription initiation protein SPT3
MYETEIRMMMYSFGDTRIPSSAACKYIEDIVKAHARILVSKSRRIQRIRRGSTLEIEDLCFVLRKDKEKVYRIIQSLNMKMLRLDASDEETLLDGEPEQRSLEFEWFNLSECKGQSERLRRLNEHTRHMSAEEYLEYSKCREASFTYRKAKKFKSFLGLGRVKDEVVDVLGFVCYEMVFELVDAALRVREERRGRSKGHDSFLLGDCSDSLEVWEIEEGGRRLLHKDKGMV